MRERERERGYFIACSIASQSVPRLWPSRGGKMGFVVASQKLKVVNGQVDDNRHCGDNHTNEICLQDIMASERE